MAYYLEIMIILLLMSIRAQGNGKTCNMAEIWGRKCSIGNDIKINPSSESQACQVCEFSSMGIWPRRPLSVDMTTVFEKTKKDATVGFLSKKGQPCGRQDEEIEHRGGHHLVLNRQGQDSNVNMANTFTHHGADLPLLSSLRTASGRYIVKNPSTSAGFSHGPIQRSFLGRIPYCNVAHLRSPSVACSGMMISPRYILTAAHCVHDGFRFHTRLKKMRVSVPSGTSFESRRVSNAHVPRRWLTNKGKQDAAAARRSDSERAVYDFAVVELLHDINSMAGCPRNGTGSMITNSAGGYKEPFRVVTAGSRRRLGFVSFPAIGELMWQTICSTLDQSLTSVRSGLLATDCPSLKGSSGAGVFVQPEAMSTSGFPMSSSLQDLIGLVSHKVDLWKNRSYTVITVLTRSKKRLVCAMTDSSVYHFCSNALPNKHRFISFFPKRTPRKHAMIDLQNTTNLINFRRQPEI
ncbi:uncharacterized protein LOC121412241 [Lytechinus variegatus]|uniref:uncharacterized protein LOC121412241 n=1 Tax=Lytechinus variegatus TaxID=7654 RepID=UPI001BB23065|nr:uncharacterized protein LOC121412241 [Lytechinus variegatus]